MVYIVPILCSYRICGVGFEIVKTIILYFTIIASENGHLKVFDEVNIIKTIKGFNQITSN